MYNKFLSVALLLCLSSVSVFAMEGGSPNSGKIEDKATEDDKGCDSILAFLDGSINLAQVEIHDEGLRNAFNYCFNNKETIEDYHRNKSIEHIAKCLTNDNINEVVHLLKIKLGLAKKEEKNKDPKGTAGTGTGAGKIKSNFNGYQAGAIVAGSAATFAVRDTLKNLVVGTFNTLKKAAIGTKNVTVRTVGGLRDAVVYKKDGNVSKTKLSALGGAGFAGVIAYVYNKKTGKIANLSNKFTTALTDRYNNSDKAKAFVKYTNDKYAGAAGAVSGYKDSTKDYFVKNNYQNTYVAIIALSAAVVIVKLAQKYFEKGQESAAEQLLISFGDVSGNNGEMSQEAINLQAKMIAGIASADVNTLISIKDDSRNMLTSEQQMLLDLAIKELQNN